MNTLIVTHLLNENQYREIFGDSEQSDFFESLLYYLPLEERLLVQKSTVYFYPIPVISFSGNDSDSTNIPEYTDEDGIEGALGEFWNLKTVAKNAKCDVVGIVMLHSNLFVDFIGAIQEMFSKYKLDKTWNLLKVDLPEIAIPANLCFLPKRSLYEEETITPIEVITYQTLLERTLLNKSKFTVRRIFDNVEIPKRSKKGKGKRKKTKHNKKKLEKDIGIYFAYSGGRN